MCKSKKMNKGKYRYKGSNEEQCLCGLLLEWEIYIVPKYDYRSSTGARFSVVSGIRTVVFDENHFLNFESQIFSRLEQFIYQ